ncbi:MAG: glycerol kinase GlpK [Aridibacter famidurans]|nr:glycerol kinase GlpK [Aridibacter famidurans]
MSRDKKMVLALDQGTTSSRAILFDETGAAVSKSQREFRQIFPRSGWVEHDPMEILESQFETAAEALSNAGVSASEVSALGITNQRETTLIWDRATGRPVSNAIVWQDRRTSDHCARVRESHGDTIRQKTGLEVDPYFSASKISWLLENVPGVRERAEAGELAFGTVDTWLVWNLTGGGVHATDVSNASRTMLFNINTLDWDEELLGIFGVPRFILPSVIPSSHVIGRVSSAEALLGIPIAGIAGDQQAALFGQRCFSEGDAKSTYGTGCFLLQNTGTSPAPSEHRLLTTVAWQIGDRCEYALEGSVFIGGAVIQWLRDSLGIIASAAEVETLAREAGSSDGVFFVPAFSGLGTPYWDPTARGLLTGLTRGTGRGQIAYAALEAIAFQTAELLEAMQNDSHREIPELKVDGGAASNDLLMQIQADLLQIPVVRPTVTETTSLGAAFLAGLATGVWTDIDQISAKAAIDASFEPSISGEEAADRMAKWKAAVEKSLNWVADGGD